MNVHAGPRSIREIVLIGALALASVAGKVEAQAPGLATAERTELYDQRDAAWNASMQASAAGEYDAALAQLEIVVDRERRLGLADRREFVRTLAAVASVQQLRFDLPAARKQSQEWLALATKFYGADGWQTIDARLSLEFVEALAKLAPAARDKLAAADKQLALVRALSAQGRYAEALPPAEKMLALRSEALGPEHLQTADAQHRLGNLLNEVGEYTRAQNANRDSLDIRRRILGERHPVVAQTLSSLASVLVATGDYRGAKPLLEQALAIDEVAVDGNPLAIATSLNNLAGLLATTGDYASARPLYERALAIDRRISGEKHRNTATSRNNLAWLLSMTGDHATATRLYEQVLAMRREVLGAEHPDTAASLNNLAAQLEANGDYRAARPLLEQALAIRRKVLGEKHPDTAEALNNLGSLLLSLEEFAEAERLCQQALAIDREALGPRHPKAATSLNSLATVLTATGDLGGAKRLYEESLAIKREALGQHHPGTAAALNNLGALLVRLGDLAGAESVLCEAAEISLQSLDQTAAAQSERQQLEMNEALRFQLDWILNVAARRPASVERGYEYVLAWKGAVFVRQHRMHLAAGRPELREIFSAWQAVSNRLATWTIATPEPAEAAAWREEVAALAAQQERLDTELARRSAAFRQSQARVTQAQLRQSLPPKTVLVDILEYAHWLPPTQGQSGEGSAEQRFVAFVVSRDSEAQMISLGAASEIAESVAAWRRAVEAERPAEMTAAGNRLRKLLWNRLPNSIREAELLLVSPDGALGQFSWAALPTEKPGSYLIQRMAVALVAVPQLLPAMLARPAGAGDDGDDGALLLVGDVEYGAPPGEQLTFGRAAVGVERDGWRKEFADISTNTRAEIAAIRDSFEQRFPDAKVLQLRRQRATEEDFRRAAGGARWLHLATHGYFAPENLSKPAGGKNSGFDERTVGQPTVPFVHPGLLCGLALTGANTAAKVGQDDGILTAVEVTALDLSAVEMAVLSACETGLGKAAGGEGLLGLQRAFQVSGAKTTVASLWKVPDRATTQLMTRFYENLWDKKMTRVAALREAQLWMLKEGGRGIDLDDDSPAKRANTAELPVWPKLWAAFVLSGDWR